MQSMWKNKATTQCLQILQKVKIFMDNRHTIRQKIIQELFSLSFDHNEVQESSDKTKKIISCRKKLNELIHEFAPKFPIDKISKIDLAILQMSIYDLTIDVIEPPKVVINEAVELAKELGSERSFAFINAVLGKIYEKYHKR